MRKFISWTRFHPITATFVLLALLGLSASWFANWRAERDWQNYCAAARARGVKLYLSEFAPPEISDKVNFAALPMFKALPYKAADLPITRMAAALSFKEPQTAFSLETGQEKSPGFGRPLKGTRINWSEWQTYFKNTGFIERTTDSGPRDVLAALERYAPQIREWEEWKKCPFSRFPLDYAAGPTLASPHLPVLLHAGKVFSLRMRAHLALGDSPAGYADFRDGLRVLAIKDEPTLIAGLERICRAFRSHRGLRRRSFRA